MVKLPIKITFLMLMVVFILIFIGMLIPSIGIRSFGIAGRIIALSEWGIFLILGTILVVLTLKNKIEGLFKKFLLLTGISAVGFFVFVVLHNLISGLLSMILNKGIDEPVFFLLAVIGCPIGFLVGSIGSLILSVKQKNRF
jgi:hypothetical protein